jgi:hypothetical protein
MKTFACDEVDRAYNILMDPAAKREEVNEVVDSINFLSKDYFQDVDTIKKFGDYIAERAKKCIGKTVKKMDFILKKMQSFIKELDFSKYEEFRDNPAGYDSQNKCTLAFSQPSTSPRRAS